MQENHLKLSPFCDKIAQILSHNHFGVLQISQKFHTPHLQGYFRLLDTLYPTILIKFCEALSSIVFSISKFNIGSLVSPVKVRKTVRVLLPGAREIIVSHICNSFFQLQ